MKEQNDSVIKKVRTLLQIEKHNIRHLKIVERTCYFLLTQIKQMILHEEVTLTYSMKHHTCQQEE